MSIPTVNVLISVHEQDGTPAVNAQVIAKLMTPERYNGFVVPDEYSGLTDASGNCTIALFPNELGTESSEYKFKIIHSNGKTINLFASIPNYDCSLHQVAELDRYELRGAGQILTLEIAQYANDAIMARDAASLSETNASNYANTASNQAGIATTQAGIASTKANEASASASAASTSASIASTHEANTATSATDANTAKVAAEAARDLAGTHKADAQAARDKAQSWAEQNENVAVETGKYSAKHHAIKAAASATSAATSRDTATTKASEAATSASNAAASATNAANSATAAANSATTAGTSASNAAASAGAASTSAATANTKATEAATSATNAANSASAAATSKTGADAARDSAITYRNEAQTARDKAKAWADNGENVYVEGSSYSAKHHAIKAAASAATALSHKNAAATSATSASTSATNAANSATTATTKANAAAASATAAATSATNAELAAASIGVMSSQGVLQSGEDTITLDWAYDPVLGNVAVYLSGVKQERNTLTFVDQYTIKVGEAVSELTSWEVVSVTMAGESMLTGLRDQAVAAKDTCVAINDIIGGKNKIINGNFDVWQRAASQTANGYGSVDRWLSERVGSLNTISRQSFALGQSEVPHNPTYFIRNVVTSVAGAGNYSALVQKIEDVRTLAGKRATLSFWAKADANKNMAVDLAQSFGSGGSPSAFITGIGKQLFALTTVWQKYIVTFDVPSIAGKSLGTDGRHCLLLCFWFDAGANIASRTSNMGQQSGTFDIAQVQLEEGEIATPFEQRTLGEETDLCLRYYEVAGNKYPLVYQLGGSGVRQVFSFSKRKRTTPTVIFTYLDYTLNASTANVVGVDVYGCMLSWIAVTTGATCVSVNYSIDAEL